MSKFYLKSYSFVFVSLFVTVCNNKKTVKVASENNIDAARNFIRAALDGKFDEARTYMLADSVNINYMDVAERVYQKANKEIKEGYKASSIRIHPPVINLNDSVSIIIYSNSYKNDPDTLRVIKKDNQWLVDLKYLYEHDTDTLFKKPLQQN